MHSPDHPIVKDLVLVGGGHSHVIVLRRIGMRPLPGVRVTVIARDIETPYSGMLPGFIAGHYTSAEMHIDLAPLAQFAGARLYQDEAVGLDPAARTVQCQARPPVPYDVLSIDIGVTPARAPRHAVPVKPIGGLVARWERLRARVRQAARPVTIGVVGAGAAGVELTLAMQHALGRNPAGQVHRFLLFGAAPTVLPTHNRRMQRIMERVLRDRGVEVHLSARVVDVEPDGIVTADGRRHPVDEIVWATEAAAPAWPAASGLEVDADGFIRVDAALQSLSHPGVFAAGDIAAVVPYPREKAGVFAVRHGPPLEVNLRRTLSGRSLRPFTPQRRYLSLVSTGDRYAVASRGRWALEGAWVWRWKDRIDRRFMRRFQSLPPMATVNVSQPTGAAPVMRCGGCGSKVGATLLDRVLPRLQPLARSDVVLGLDAPDDAAIEHVPPGAAAVRTVDAFRAIVDDPYTFGRIAANHCLGDVYAMGAEPRTALALATIPLGPERQMEQVLEALLSGAVEVLNAAETALVGGHTKEGSDVELGLAISGVGDPATLLRKSGMRPGDRLLVTKPIGTGTLFAAHMQRQARGRWIAAALAMMVQSSRAASAILRAHGATACTDVTGFGLLGHLIEMSRASGVGARLHLAAVPLLEGAAETAAAGRLSSLHPDNVRARHAIGNLAAVQTQVTFPLLFDPQTAGGLLASVPAAAADTCLEQLRAAGYAQAADVGAVEQARDPDAPIQVDP